MSETRMNRLPQTDVGDYSAFSGLHSSIAGGFVQYMPCDKKGEYGLNLCGGIKEGHMLMI